jgi:hypothetical protein
LVYGGALVRNVIALWGVLGVVALVGKSLVVLTPVALEVLRPGALEAWQWGILLVWVGFMAYSEGWVGFHRKFSPRVVARAFGLSREPTALRVLLAAPYCLSLFDAPRRNLVTSWALVLTIAALVLGVRRVPQPWRGIVDAGVVVGLTIGLASLVLAFGRGLQKGEK